MKWVFLALVGAVNANLLKYAPATFAPKAGACAAIKCSPVQCDKPFVWVSAEDAGTCCAVCDSNGAIQVPEDRSWVENLPGNNQGSHTNADPVKCAKIYCPPLPCPVEDHVEGDCCSKCK